MKQTVTYRNPVAKAMLQERKSPQVILPKKGNKAKRNRQQEKVNAIRNAVPETVMQSLASLHMDQVNAKPIR